MDINVDSVFRACQAALAPMRKQQSGVILNIGSISGYISNIPQPQAAYNASKAAVHMLTKSLASDYAAENIRVNAIAPGYIDTDMTAGGFANPEWAPVWRGMTPMPKVGTPEDIGAAALYLCSPASGYVTGEVLVVDGGYLDPLNQQQGRTTMKKPILAALLAATAIGSTAAGRHRRQADRAVEQLRRQLLAAGDAEELGEGHRAGGRATASSPRPTPSPPPRTR